MFLATEAYWGDLLFIAGTYVFWIILIVALIGWLLHRHQH